MYMGSMGRNIRSIAAVEYNGSTYIRNLRLCWRALTRCQVEGRLDGGVTALGSAAGVSRSTASRFLAGRNVSLENTQQLLRVLGLGFDEVHSLQPDLSDLALATSSNGA